MTKSLKRRLSTWVMLGLTFYIVGCASFPLTLGLHKWAAQSCGRSSFFRRVGSGFVVLAVSPIMALMFVVDIPLSLIEFMSGEQIVKDPLLNDGMPGGNKSPLSRDNGVKLGNLDFDKKTFLSDGVRWDLERTSTSQSEFLVTRTEKDKSSVQYILKKLANGELEMEQLTPNGDNPTFRVPNSSPTAG